MRASKILAPILLCVSLHGAGSCSEFRASSTAESSMVDIPARVDRLLMKVKRTLRPIKGGTFEMGDWGTESGRPYDIDTYSRPVHKVTLDGFSMMAYKVTYDDFDVFTDATGGERIAMSSTQIEDRGPQRPAGVSWHGAKAYCKWLGKLTNLPFDLATEAQWEYAARSEGKRMLFATDNGKIDRGRNFPKEWQHGEKEPPLPDVGSYPPNPVGLYGLSEDTSEWVNDWFDENYYKISPEKNPVGPDNGIKKVKRGSVGGTAEIAAMVFMRTKAIPQPLRTTYPNGVGAESILVPFEGYSGYMHTNFRCVLNVPNK